MGKTVLGCLALILGMLSVSNAKADILDIDTSALDARTAAIVERVEQRIMNEIANDFSQALPRFMLQQLKKIEVVASFDPNADGLGGVLASAAITNSLDYNTRYANISVAQDGQMFIDQADANALSDNELFTVITHEVFHNLGFGGGSFMRNALVNGTRYIGQNGVEGFRKDTGFAFLTSVPLEQGGGAGTAGSHWAANVPGLQGPGFQDLMQGFADFNNQFRISNASMGVIRDVHLTMTVDGFESPIPPLGPNAWKRPPIAVTPAVAGGAGAGAPVTDRPGSPDFGAGGIGGLGSGAASGAVSSVPEPTGATVLVLGFVGLVMRRRRA